MLKSNNITHFIVDLTNINVLKLGKGENGRKF